MRSGRRRRERVFVTVVGAVSTLFGIVLTIRPIETATILGWGPARARHARVIGAADLVIGPALVTSRHTTRWMTARAVLNAILATVYGRVLISRDAPEPRRARVGLVAMSSVTVIDALAARRLRNSGR